MKEQTKRNVLALCEAADQILVAANDLWWANNPDEIGGDGEPPTLEDAQEAYSEAFQSLRRATCYARRAIDKEAALMGANGRRVVRPAGAMGYTSGK